NGANLSGAQIVGVNSALGADMSDANLANASLKNVDFRPNTFDAVGTATIVTASLSGAFLCGTILDSTHLESADLSGAYIPQTATTLTGADGQPFTCGAVTMSPFTSGPSASASPPPTTCPDGSPGLAANGTTPAGCSGTQWNIGTVPTPPCCTVQPGSTTTCKALLKSGGACSTPCD